MTLGPPLWATGSWATNAWADGTWATTVNTVTEFDDLTWLFSRYIPALLAAHAGADDISTQLRDDLATARASTGGSAHPDDLNTMYAAYLTPLY